jgi:hypothetical protein
MALQAVLAVFCAQETGILKVLFVRFVSGANIRVITLRQAQGDNHAAELRSVSIAPDFRMVVTLSLPKGYCHDSCTKYISCLIRDPKKNLNFFKTL